MYGDRSLSNNSLTQRASADLKKKKNLHVNVTSSKFNPYRKGDSVITIAATLMEPLVVLKYFGHTCLIPAEHTTCKNSGKFTLDF